MTRRTRLRFNDDTDDINALKATGPGVGTSGVSGIRTRALTGDPTRPGVYTIQLEVPANTRIEAHDHPDDRVATVVSGTWYFSYAAHFDEKALKALPTGSFYTEPSRRPHFARTRNTTVKPARHRSFQRRIVERDGALDRRYPGVGVRVELIRGIGPCSGSDGPLRSREIPSEAGLLEFLRAPWRLGPMNGPKIPRSSTEDSRS